MKSNAVARPYAQAAFDFAVSHDQLHVWLQSLSKLAQALTNKKLQVLLKNPQVDRNEVSQVLIAVCSEGNDSVANFIKLLTENKRLFWAPLISQLFEGLKTEHERKLHVEFYSPFALELTQREKLVSVLTEKYDRQIELHDHIDQSLIGGALLRIGDRVIDNTVIGRVNRLKTHFKLKGSVCQHQ